MPQALAAAIITAFAAIGFTGTAAAITATIIATAVFAIGTTFISRLLFGGGGVKADTTERSIKSPTPSRVHLYGKRRMFGSWQLFETSSLGATVDVWAFLDGRAHAVTTVYLNDEAYAVADGAIVAGADGAYGGGKVSVGHNLGLDVESAFAPVVAALPGIWSSAHRGDGIVSAYLIKAPVKDKDFLKIYPQGDNVILSLAIEGQLCFDPREAGHDPDDDSTWAYTENAVLHLLHYYMVRRGYSYAEKIEPVEAYWIAAANDCDDPTALDAGGTEPRYRSCVSYDATKLPADVISELLACFDGWTAHDENGCILVYSGRLYEPVVTIGPNEIIAYSHQSFVEDENRINELIVQYVSADHDFATVEGTPWRDEADISARGRVVSDGFAPQVPSLPQARRLAKRAALRRNAENRGSVTTNFSGRSAIGERYVNLLLAEAGEIFFNGVAEIIGLERDYDTGGVTFEWVAVDAALDEWEEGTEEGSAAPPPEHVDPSDLDAPEITDATPVYDADGARLSLTITAPDRDDLTWFAHWRVDGESLWGSDMEFPDLAAGASVEIVTDVVLNDSLIEVQVAYRVGDGRLSPWSASVTADTSTGGSGEAVIDFDGGDASTEVEE